MAGRKTYYTRAAAAAAAHIVYGLAARLNDDKKTVSVFFFFCFSYLLFSVYKLPQPAALGQQSLVIMMIIIITHFLTTAARAPRLKKHWHDDSRCWQINHNIIISVRAVPSVFFLTTSSSTMCTNIVVRTFYSYTWKPSCSNKCAVRSIMTAADEHSNNTGLFAGDRECVYILLCMFFRIHISSRNKK